MGEREILRGSVSKVVNGSTGRNIVGGGEERVRMGSVEKNVTSSKVKVSEGRK